MKNWSDREKIICKISNVIYCMLYELKKTFLCLLCFPFQDYKDKISELEIQRNELLQTLKMKRGELHKRKEEVETEDEVLHKLINSVNKNKSELQHIFEMQKIEKHELDSLKSQHAQKLSELEKTQRELLEVMEQ